MARCSTLITAEGFCELLKLGDEHDEVTGLLRLPTFTVPRNEEYGKVRNTSYNPALVELCALMEHAPRRAELFRLTPSRAQHPCYDRRCTEDKWRRFAAEG